MYCHIMKWSLSIICLAVLFVENGLAKLIPDFIHPCPVDDFACMKQSAKYALPHITKGIPEFGVPSMDPFYVEKLSLPLPGLQVSFYRGKVFGFRNAKIDKVESNFLKQILTVAFHANITLEGGYEAKGRILTFSIDGEGDVDIKISNLKMKITLNTHIVPDENNVRHIGVKNYKYTCDYGKKATYNLTNLFKGKPELTQTVLTFMNQNWRLVAEEFGKPILDYATELAVRTLEKFFVTIPVEELIDGPIPSFD